MEEVGLGESGRVLTRHQVVESDPGELYCPHGIAIHEDTHQIFVANEFNRNVEIFLRRESSSISWV